MHFLTHPGRVAGKEPGSTEANYRTWHGIGVGITRSRRTVLPELRYEEFDEDLIDIFTPSSFCIPSMPQRLHAFQMRPTLLQG